jgi:hypothetical protein
MTTNSSRLALRVTATHRGAGKEAFAHMSRDDSHARIKAGCSNFPSGSAAGLPSWGRHRVTRPKAPTTCPALAWIQRSLEGAEATIIGLPEVIAPFRGIRGSCPFSSRKPGSPRSAGGTGRLDQGSC